MSKSPNRILGLVFGIVFVVIGVYGFFVTSGVGFFATSGGKILGIFEVNVFHNIAHLLIGAILAVAALVGVSSAKPVNTVIGGAYLVLGIAGLFLAGTGINILAINAADNVLHFASSVVLLAVGLGAERPTRRTSAA